MVLTQCIIGSVTNSATINLYLEQTDSRAYKHYTKCISRTLLCLNKPLIVGVVYLIGCSPQAFGLSMTDTHLSSQLNRERSRYGELLQDWALIGSCASNLFVASVGPPNRALTIVCLKRCCISLQEVASLSFYDL